MAKEVFHTIRHLKRTFTLEEWQAYCDSIRNDEDNRIVTRIGKYLWNHSDICLNPETEEVVIKKKDGWGNYSAEIRYANCGNGVWAFGYEYNIGTAGGCSGVAWADKADINTWNKGFESERECKKFAWRYLLTRVLPQTERNDLAERLYREVEKKYKEYSRPQIVQLELFG